MLPNAPRVAPPQVPGLMLWPSDQAWRAPVGDFPPPWAQAWGDDAHGLWADFAVGGVVQRMRWIEPTGPAGFWMGAPQAERDALHHKDLREWANECESEPQRVLLAQGYWLADTPCTQALWQAVMGGNPSHFRKHLEDAVLPVEQVCWDDVAQFLAALGQRPGMGGQRQPALPTEAEWEYAARAGSRTAYWWGDVFDPARANADAAGNKAWDAKQGTTPVQQFAPNPWGLHDMHGNVWEWCADVWQPRQHQPQADADEAARAVRGGSWFDHPGDARAACRIHWHRGVRGRNLGFRVLLRSPAQVAR